MGEIRAENPDASNSVPRVEQYPDRGQSPVEGFRDWRGSTGGAVEGQGEGSGSGFSASQDASAGTRTLWVQCRRLGWGLDGQGRMRFLIP